MNSILNVALTSQMKIHSNTRAALTLWLMVASQPAHAFFFILPIPNFSKPPPLNALIDALEKSEETKAVAYVSESKLFGSKFWVWGHHSGHVPQAEADRIALQACANSLANSKAQMAGGKPLYDYGTKACELYSFSNRAVSPRAGEWKPAVGTVMISFPVSATPVPAASASAAETTAQPQAAVPASAAASSTAEAPGKVAPVTPAAAAESATPPSQSQGATPGTESPTVRKLRELEALRKEGLISETEYQEKRKAIIAAM
jgi:hypothetical protein